MARKNKLIISENQLDLLKIIYATMLGVRYHNLRSRDLFGGNEVNHEWWKERNVLGHYTPKQFVKDIPPAKEWSWYSKGFLRFRKTKKGAVVFIELVRLREK